MGIDYNRNDSVMGMHWLQDVGLLETLMFVACSKEYILKYYR